MNRIAVAGSIVLALTATAATAAMTTVVPDDVTADERRAVVEGIGALITQRYVFPDVAEQAAEHLQAQLDAGELDVADPERFAERLTDALQSVTHDKHMRVRPRAPARVAVERESPARARAERRDRERRQNHGFEKVERLEGNVGYLDLRYFSGSPAARETAAAAMRFLANADALVFDMRQNGGGNPDMIRFLCSYLFEERTHLNSLYWREGDRTQEFWTLDEVPGPRLADVPAFVLTSGYTFSGAEEFSYNLKTRKRATLVGETTGGGANPGGMFPITERFAMFVPTGRAINPITGTNWEGVGVEPDVAATADEAYEIALELARKAAADRRDAAAARTAVLWESLSARQAEATALSAKGRHEAAAAVMTDALHEVHQARLLGEMDVNMLGYELMGADAVELAVAVFRFNVEAYPESANVHDSLGEACMNAGRTAEAIRHYRRSLELDPENANAEAMIARMREGGA